MAYNFNKKENEITKLLPAYIFNYSDDNGKGLFLFIKYLTNYIETANEALDTICSELNVNSDKTFILDILAKKLGVEIPTTITSVEDKQTVLKGKIMTLSSTGCAQALIDTIYGLYPDWHKYDSKGTPIEVGDTLEKLFYNTNETPTLEGLGWDNADETKTTTDDYGVETVTKILNVLVSTAGPVVQLVRKESDGLTGYSVIVHYTTDKNGTIDENNNVNAISYKDENTCDIEDLVDTVMSAEIEEVRSNYANKKTFDTSSENIYNYPEITDMYYTSYRDIVYTNIWESIPIWNWIMNLRTANIWTDGINTYYSQGNAQYQFTSDGKWKPKIWEGLTDFDGCDIWTDLANNIYYSSGTTQYQLVSQNTWIPKTDWDGLTDFAGQNIWTDGKKIYYSVSYHQYELVSQNTWKSKIWNGLREFSGNPDIWADLDNNIYYSNGKKQYQLVSPDTWKEKKDWGGLTDFYGRNIWTDGKKIYYSYGTNQCQLNKYRNTYKWETKTWEGLKSPNGSAIWTDGANIYHSNSTLQYKLNNDTWSPKTWEGLTDFDGNPAYIWHDLQNNIYYSKGSAQYKLNKQSLTWESITWTGLTNLNGSNVWLYVTSGNSGYNKVYCSFYDETEKTQVTYNLNGTSWEKTTIQGPAGLPDGRYMTGSDIWSDGAKTYCSIVENGIGYNYEFNGNSWNTKNWTGLTKIISSNIFRFKDTIYYSEDSTSEYYKLDTQNSKWAAYTWNDNIQISGNDIWTDGVEYYYSSKSKRYKLNSVSLTWETISWQGQYPEYGRNIWRVDDNVFYSNTHRLKTKKGKKIRGQKKLNENYQEVFSTESEDNGYLMPVKFYRDDAKQNFLDSGTIKGIDVWKNINDGGVYYNGNDTNGNNISLYYNSKSKAWLPKTWTTPNNVKLLNGKNIYTIDNNIYYTYKENDNAEIVSLQLDTEDTWVNKSWGGYIKNGSQVWKTNNNSYYGANYKFIKDIREFNTIDWVFPNGLFFDFYGRYIWSCNGEIYYNYNNDSGTNISLHLTKDSYGNYTHTWETKSWNVTIPSGEYIWTDNTNTYYSKGTVQYKFYNGGWIPMNDWKGLTDFDGDCVWSDGTNIYYSKGTEQYELVSSDTWKAKTEKPWTGLDNNRLDGNCIWTDGEKIYYSNYLAQYKLDDNKLNWSSMTWTGLESFYGYNIWCFNNNIYCSYKYLGATNYGHYILDKSSMNESGTECKWKRIVWLNYSNFEGQDIWTDGQNTFANKYVLNSNEVTAPEPVSWYNITVGELAGLDSANIWHIGDTTYYSNGTVQCKINEDTQSFDTVTWKGLTEFNGSDIWADAEGNIFYKDTYVLDTKTNTWILKYWDITDNKSITDNIKAENIWEDPTTQTTYISNDYALNSYKDIYTVSCKFNNNDKKLSIQSKLTRDYKLVVNKPPYLQHNQYYMDLIKLPNKLVGWHSPYGISSPVKTPEFNITKETRQNEWGRYIAKNNEFNPIIRNAVSVIDEGSLLQDAKNMHYRVIIDGPKIDEPEQTILKNYLIPKFLGVKCEVEFK